MAGEEDFLALPGEGAGRSWNQDNCVNGDLARTAKIDGFEVVTDRDRVKRVQGCGVRRMSALGCGDGRCVDAVELRDVGAGCRLARPKFDAFDVATVKPVDADAHAGRMFKMDGDQRWIGDELHVEAADCAGV